MIDGVSGQTGYEEIGLMAHGGVRVAELRQLGLDANEVIDFSASVNPYGPSPVVRRALQQVRLDRYPDVDCTELLEHLSQMVGRPAEWLMPGNGATELIHAAARVWAGPGLVVGHVPPTFGEYAAAASAIGAPVRALAADALGDSRLMVDRPALLFLCNPNNPTGELLTQAYVERTLAMMAPRPVVVDEAYIRFVNDAWSILPLLDRFENLVVIRSMTKDYGLTALRLGYALARPERIAEIKRLLPPWNVNGLAQAAGVAALKDPTYIDVTLGKMSRSKVGLVRGLRALRLPVVEGAANFVLAEVGSGERVRTALAHRGILVRDCYSFGLPRHIRIAVRRPAEHRRLLAVLAGIISEDDSVPVEQRTIAIIDE
ncbi:MAG: pyridoxal phosphate-dependent aminotransferase [Chloroflexota bacterium]